MGGKVSAHNLHSRLTEEVHLAGFGFVSHSRISTDSDELLPMRQRRKIDSRVRQKETTLMFTPDADSEILKKASYAAYDETIKDTFRTLFGFHCRIPR